MPDQVQPVHLPPSHCQETLKMFARQQFEAWVGLSGDCHLADIFAQFKRLNDGIGHGELGVESAQFVMVLVPNYLEPVRVWYRAEKIVLLDTAYPDFLQAGTAGLGEPDARLDYNWKRLFIPNGLWVYLARGLALHVNSENGALIHLTVFAPTSLYQYQQTLALSLRTERLPYRDI